MARQYKTGLIITGDASGGVRAIRSTEKELGQLNRGFDQGARRSKRFAQNVGGSSKELQLLRRAAAPVAAVVAGMFARQALQSQIQFGDELNKLNLRIGAGAEALSEYRYVAEQAGVQFGTLATAWQRQTRRIAQAATQGTGEAVKALETLNLSARELNQLRPEEQFERISGALQGVANEGLRTALAMSLWDTEGVSLLQVVNQGTEAMQQQREEARRLGLTISDETAQAMADYSSAMTRLQAVGTGVSRQLLAELVPAMTESLQATSAWIDGVGGAPVILDGIKDAATGVAVVLAGRYAGSLATATAAKLAATRQAVLYQAPLARMAGVSSTAAASQVALSAATRGAAGAMALLGGPVGAAVVAGAAVYYFREELGLVREPIEAATSEVDALTNAINMNSEAALKNAIAELTQDLSDLERAAGSAASDVQTLLMQGPGPGRSGVSVTGRRPSLSEARVAEDEADQEVANYTAAIARLEDQLKSLGESSITPARNIASISDASKDAKKAAEQLEQRYESIADQLSRQIALFGSTSEVAKLRYEIEHGQLQGLAADRAQHILSMQEELALLQDQKRITGQYLPELEKLQQLKRDAQVIDAMGGSLGNLAARQLEQQLAGIATQGLAAPTGLHASVSGPMGEAARLDQEMAQYQAQYEQRLEMLRAFTDEEYGIRSEASRAIEQLERQHQQTVQQYEQQSQAARMQGYAGMFGSLANLSTTFAGDSAGITKGLIAFQQAANLATTISNMAAAQSQAGASMPFPANIAAMATVAAQGAALVSTIGSIVSPPEPSFSASNYSISGQAHDGIDRIPAEGTWLLDKGERVLSRPQTDRLDEYLRKQENGGRSGEVKITYSPVIQVEASPGATERDGQRLAQGLDAHIKTTFYQLIQKEQRPGGALAKR